MTLELSPLAQERLAYRRSRARRSTLVALVSTVVFAAVVARRRHEYARLAARPGDVPRPRDRLVVAPGDPRGAVAQRPRAGRHRDRRARAGPADRGAADPARPGVLPVPRARDRLRRPVPRRAAADRAVPDRLRGARAAAAGRADQRGRARHDHADPRLLRLRRRGVPRRDRVDPPLAAGGGALAGPDPPPVDAAGDPPAGRPAGAAAAAQRLRRAAEGRRADLRARCGRRDPGRADRVGAHVQLHAVRRGRAAVRAARGPDRPDRGRPGGPGRAPAGPGSDARSRGPRPGQELRRRRPCCAAST